VEDDKEIVLIRLSAKGRPEVNLYLIRGEGGVLVDGGYGDRESVDFVLQSLRDHGQVDLSAVVVTHCHPDHFGGAPEISRRTGAELLIPAGETLEEKLSTKWRRVEEGERINSPLGELIVVHTPGHTSGHICLYLPSRGVLFTGDTVVGEGTTWVGPPDGDMKAYLHSLERLKELSARLILPGHGPPIKDPSSWIEQLIRHRLMRERQILAALEEGMATVEEIVNRVYSDLVPHLRPLASLTVRGHLEKLLREGRVTQRGERWVRREER